MYIVGLIYDICNDALAS